MPFSLLVLKFHFNEKSFFFFLLPFFFISFNNLWNVSGHCCVCLITSQDDPRTFFFLPEAALLKRNIIQFEPSSSASCVHYANKLLEVVSSVEELLNEAISSFSFFFCFHHIKEYNIERSSVVFFWRTESWLDYGVTYLHRPRIPNEDGSIGNCIMSRRKDS